MENLTMYNANYLKVRLDDGTITYIEEQEHCDIWWRTPEDGVAGDYFFNFRRLIFYPRKNRDEWFFCDVLAYSHDYGKTWAEV